MNGFAHGKLSVLLAIGLVVLTSLLPVALQAQNEAQGPTFSSEQLEQIVAPIALYPDALLAQVLMASTYPLEVVEAARFAQANPSLEDKALDDALQQRSWDPSVKSLVSFPQVLTMMDERLDWTQKLGDAVLAQQKDVMDAVQRLRAKAQAEGNLKTTEQQKVIVEEAPPSGGTTVIVIEPANPQVVYVPTYNPTVVYGAWPYPAYPPYYYYPPGYVAATSLLSFGVGVAVGSALWGGCNWGRGNVDINVNRYNNFNQNVTKNYNQTNVQNKYQNGNWQHDPSHRKGAQYRDSGTQERYGRGQSSNVASRDAYRGRAEQGRQQIAREGIGGGQGQLGQGGAAGSQRPTASTRPAGGAQGGAAAGSQRPTASTRPAGGAQGGAAAGSQRPTASTRPAGGAQGGAAAASQRPTASTKPAGDGRPTGDRSPKAFEGSANGAQARRDSDRGRASRESAASSGGRAGSSVQRTGGAGGAQRTGGGGAQRAGGGGGRSR